ncbi:MAG: 50S ribosomal protein L24 [Candidatus Lloydbacteria bacterium RIFCSPHIGHO2_02_FULL_54_17]|uniref:Large ribosomal subunit protein uL24 n=1 Tax=Candidatus Lloydbacteria bacterium RIFCSPHIGHO2_02_FULL_54_17 TaxID=1798664 RepID=A0A1G2DET4_9BACT|nr:MAG: 50S ribosomal protein L24 [Candidatus Lloydbacteria bacterium RIFCSPHIGHO2_01_FULL_54_11]OGZ12157.1 MAG: 50S ribosomal protein L24 [Candidatus Lloydbacteria bacterium RIFCSPHIGHO2_02_FULL_54_17]OGZ12948.1 MAG: 50S ribosomal protein L24 [Candidatus Lloydbacteria bacterium RIFCSPLOWO2_01_FULL_54_18]OGZ15946.1 MAG: 50S ribosomal protein L24 [Candidatus Lloydbacteria bacterium RIFCSPLOWO2_02_FULL_54_12]
MTNIKKGDTVRVLSGDDKGKRGKVLRLMPKEGLAVVEGVNMKKKHRRARQEGKKGQVIDIALPVNIAKLALVESKK